ncbi:MAG: alpha/beta hydrolase [Oscillospiraceae bacterium]|nr:alpha/beta hydrolase [Oscillospiraceae bacterium]
MRLIIKIVAVLLAAILLAAGGFWFWCRAVNHRSFMAGFVDLFLVLQHRSDKFTYSDAADKYIESKADANREYVVIDSAKFGISLREERYEGLQAFIYNDQEHHEQTVFYFHGGAYVNQPNNQQTTMAARTAKETGAEVVLIVYPKMPVYTCEDAYRICTGYYNYYINDYDCGKIVFMGDSAGGGLALGMAQQLKEQGKPEPEELILISPWVDLTMSNRDLVHFTVHDPMLGIDGCRRMGEIWAGDLPVTDPMVSPIYGDLALTSSVTVTTGTWEVLYPDTMLLVEKMREAGTDVALVEGDRMIHCYPICPIPEAKDAQKVIWDAVTR